MFNIKKFLPIAAVVAIGLTLGGCFNGTRNYAGSPMGGSAYASTVLADNDYQVVGGSVVAGRAYAAHGRVAVSRGCQYGRPVTTPGGRTTCVEHITDAKFLHQPQFNKADRRASICAGKQGQLIRIGLGGGLVGNYRC